MSVRGQWPAGVLSMFLTKHLGETGSGSKEPHIANNLTLKMKEYEKITDAEMQTVGRVGASLLTILGVVAAVFVVVSILAALVLGSVVLFYGWATFHALGNLSISLEGISNLTASSTSQSF